MYGIFWECILMLHVNADRVHWGLADGWPADEIDDTVNRLLKDAPKDKQLHVLLYQTMLCMLVEFLFFRWNICKVNANFLELVISQQQSKYQNSVLWQSWSSGSIVFKVHEITEIFVVVVIIIIADRWRRGSKRKKYVQWRYPFERRSFRLRFYAIWGQGKNILQILWLTLHDSDLARNWFFSTSSKSLKQPSS